MGEKDITEKILADYNDVFADIMNGLLFAGEQRILPEALENTSIHSQYKAEDEKVHELERDVAKYWKEKEVELAICGIENQSVVEKNMPFRVIGYDGTAYRSQLLEERKKILPEGLDKFVNDYSMQVFEIAWLTEEEIERFQSDFRIVANFFVKKRKNKDYIPDDPTEIKHVDEVLKLLQVMTGDDRYKEMFKKKKEVHSMCDVAERLEKMGIAKGIELGREEQKKASRVEFILRVLETKGTVDEKTRKRIEEEPDVDRLDIWFTKALKANTVQEFEQALD